MFGFKVIYTFNFLSKTNFWFLSEENKLTDIEP